MRTLQTLVGVGCLALFAHAAGAQTFFFTGAGAIPDGPSGNPGTFGVPRVLTAASTASNPIQDVIVTINMTHTWLGDLRVRLAYTPTGSAITYTATVINRVGALGAGSAGEDGNLNGNYVFVLGATSFLDATAPLGNDNVLASGSYAPVSSNLNGTHTLVEFADTFRGLSGTGAWTLTFEDGTSLDTGVVNSANIALQARTIPCLADFNTDGVVNTTDLTFFLGRFGNTCQ